MVRSLRIHTLTTGVHEGGLLAYEVRMAHCRPIVTPSRKMGLAPSA
jgi:hypothetical protein